MLNTMKKVSIKIGPIPKIESFLSHLGYLFQENWEVFITFCSNSISIQTTPMPEQNLIRLMVEVNVKITIDFVVLSLQSTSLSNE